jgi:hypothetical protein
MKGQIFIITSILILIALLLIRANTKTIEIEPEELFYENFLNLRNELISTIDLSLLNGDVVSTNMNNFISFSTGVLKKKGYDETVTYFVDGNVIYLNVSLSSGRSYLKENLIINRTVYT